MNDKYEREELQQALELDALLDTWLAGRSAAAKGESKLSVQEATFAQQVVQLAQETEPDPAFVTRLENQLRWAARQGAAASRQESAPPRKLFWQELRDVFTGRRTLMTAGALAVVAALVIIVWPLLNPTDNNVTGEETRLALVATSTPTTISESLVEESNTEEQTITSLSPEEMATATPSGERVTPPSPEADSPEEGTATPEIIAAISPTPDPALVTKLPVLNGGASMGLGGGGGAGGPGSGGAGGDTTMGVFENRLAEAQFNLTAPIPTVPDLVTVYQYQQTDPSLAQIQAIGNKFDFTGPVYYDAWYDRAIQNPELGWIGPRVYYQFDGGRFFNVIGNSFSFSDNSVYVPGSNWQLMPYEEAVPVALAYAQAHDLLDFPYELVPMPYNDSVSFYRIINGVRNATPELSISVMENGVIFSAYLVPFMAFNPVSDYPLISVEAAWELAQTDPDYQTVFVNIQPDPATLPPVPTPDPRYRSWYRTYEEGDAIALDVYPQVFRPLEAGVPLVLRGNEYFLGGDEALLEQIAAATDQNIHVTGTIQGNISGAQTILVSEFAVVEAIQEWVLREGVIRITEEGLVVLDTIQGETLLIPNAPADLPAGEHVNVGGPIIREGDPYPLFDWTNMDRFVEPDFIPEEEYLFPTPVPITQVNIDQVELIYYYTFVSDPEFDGPGQEWLQPAWRFTGTTDTGELVEIIVQAVEAAYVQPPITP
ncbi:MAG: hypothetical protein KA314_07845 [Chloroflexi bacterium]|nr:hypothetical protein [Chloroflexota bacterium]